MITGFYTFLRVDAISRKLKKGVIWLVLLMLISGFLFPQNAVAQCNVVDFKANVTKGCPLLLVKFTAKGTSSAAGTSFQWDFGNGFVNGNDTITKAFSTPGQYTVKMLATLSGSNTPCPVVVKDTYITVLPIPVPVMVASTGFLYCDYTTNMTVKFTDKTPNTVKRDWVINSKSDTNRNVSVSFPKSGSYTISLYSTNKYGCQGFLSQPLQLVDSVGVDICANFSVTQSGTTGTFSPAVGNTKGRTVTGYAWQFPGGTPSSSTDQYPPDVSYPDPNKKYDVILAITMDNGCVYTRHRKAFVSPFLSPAFQTECASGFEVDVDITDGKKGGWNFNFPSGNYLPIPGPMPAPPPPGILSYPIGGKYSAGVSYNYSDGLGCNINVNYPFFVKAIGPRADYKSNDNQICDPTDTVHFINMSDTTGAFNVVYTWKIYDSTDTQLLKTNNQIGPTYNYDTFYIPGRTGKFGVTLMAKSANGCMDTVNKADFIVAARPISDFDSLVSPIICLGDVVNLHAKPTPAEGSTFSYTYKWLVKDELLLGLPDSAFHSTYSYFPDSLGPYDVDLLISNGHCSSDTFKKAFFTVIGDITKIKIANNAGCLSPDFTTTVSVGHEEKYPNDPNNPPLYHWYLDPDETSLKQYIKFADASAPSTTVTISHTGCYTIYLNITTIDGIDTCVKVYPKAGQPSSICTGPAVSFGVGQLLCPGDTVNISNFSPTADFGFKWQILPASMATILPSDTSRDIRVVLKADTCYSVILSGSRTINGATCSDADTVSGFCFNLPKPDFISTTPTFYCAPAVGIFKNNTKHKAGATAYLWDFGDGTTFLDPDSGNVSHIYFHFNAGSYNVSLTALDPSGCNEKITKQTAIDVVGPVPLFTMDKKVSCDSIMVNFTNTSKNVKKFYFLYDDGSGVDSVSLKPHEYSLNDSSKDSIIYYPTLLSLDDPTCRDYFQDTIKIYRTPSDVKIKTDVSIGCNPLTVQFTAVSQAANTWLWDFDGDGIIDDSTDKSPVFTYQKPGFYRARVTVTNHGSCQYSVLSDTITVAPNAGAGFVPSSMTICGTQGITFKNTSTNTVRFLFDYGDGSPVDTNRMAIHKYYYDPSHDTGEAHIFYPSMIAYNAGGCADTLVDSIIAYRMPVPGFSYSAIVGCSPLQVFFKDSSKYNFASEWDFDNNGTFDGYGKTIDWIYGPGLYTVKMRAITINGCVDSAIKVNLVIVNAVPKADFSVSDSDVCYQDTVRFTNLTQPADSIVQWIWNFDDLAAPYDTSTVKNPSFAFYSKGWHNVTLTAVDNRGCTDTIQKRAVFVEDTIPPQDPNLLYVSVLDTHSVQVNYNKSNIRRFDAYKINLLSNGVPVTTDTVTNINDTAFTFKDTAINTSDSSYCFSIQALNQCGKVSFGSQTHCTVLLGGVANPGPANLLNWSAYSGWSADWYYIYRADNGGAFKKIDSVRGSTVNYSDTALCDETYCYYVVAKNNKGGFLSNSNPVCLKSKYVHDNTPLYMHYATVQNNSVVKLEWDSSKYKGLVGYQLGKYSYPKGVWIDNYAFTGSNSYVDAAARVNDSSYTYRVKTIDKCGYMGPESNLGTSILLKQNINQDNVLLTWNSYRNWQAGVQLYLVQVQLKNKQFKTVAKVSGNDTTYTDDSVYNYIDTAYCYRVIALESGTRQDSSVSNLTCAVLPSRIFVPNAFSPNGDTINDTWKVSALSVYNVIGKPITQFSAKIYNRWGMLVFESNDIYKGWDGTFKGAKSPADVYIYVISAEGIDKKYIQIRGNLTLIR